MLHSDCICDDRLPRLLRRTRAITALSSNELRVSQSFADQSVSSPLLRGNPETAACGSEECRGRPLPFPSTTWERGRAGREEYNPPRRAGIGNEEGAGGGSHGRQNVCWPHRLEAHVPAALQNRSQGRATRIRNNPTWQRRKFQSLRVGRGFSGRI
jgi:hypothetical protein